MNDNLRNYTLIDHEDDWKDSFRQRLNNSRSTSRLVINSVLVSVLVSMGLMLANFSYFYSWNKKFADDYTNRYNHYHATIDTLFNRTFAMDSIVTTNKVNFDKDSIYFDDGRLIQLILKKNLIKEKYKLDDIVEEGAIKEWLSVQTWELPILGLKIMDSDFPIIASIVFILITTWLFYVSRREHYTVGRLLSDAFIIYKDSIEKKEAKGIIMCQEIYHSIIADTVFNVVPYDKPIISLYENMKPRNQIKHSPYYIPFRKIIIWLVLIAPIISILFIVETRIDTFIGIKSMVTGEVHSWSNLTYHRKWLLGLSFIFSLIGLIICILNAVKTLKLFKATRDLLDDYQLFAFKGVVPKKHIVHNKQFNRVNVK